MFIRTWFMFLPLFLIFFTGDPVSEAFVTASFYFSARLLCLGVCVSVLTEKDGVLNPAKTLAIRYLL